jgi:hypothetical protein
MTTEKKLADANELMLNDEYDMALNVLSQTIHEIKKEDHSKLLFQCLYMRSNCFTKVKFVKNFLWIVKIDKNILYIFKNYSLLIHLLIS